jgi:hypothetical protein
MRQVRTTAVLLLLAVLSLAACSGSKGSNQATPGSAGATTTTAAPRTPGTPTSTGKAGTTDTTKTSTDAVWSSAPKTATRSVTSIPRLVNVRFAHHPSFDRIVFDFQGEAPGYRVEYVDQVSQDGSGEPVPLQGRAFLSVVFTPADMHDARGNTTYSGPKTLTPRYPSLRQAKFAGDFEGYVSWGLGLDDTVGFRVRVLSAPTRIAIDVAA